LFGGGLIKGSTVQRSFSALMFIWLAVCPGMVGGRSHLAFPGEFSGQEPDWNAARQRMVQQEIIGAGIRDPRVQRAMRDTPRHEFVPAAQRKLSYYDMALPIGGGQTISPPFVVASMTEHLQPAATDKVLEIGTGSGYQAAVLSPLVAEVYSIEIVEELGKTASETLRRLNYANVHTRIGDGFLGWPEQAPFDKIIVTCSPERVPPALVDQLREGGRMVIPLGERYQQTLYLFKKVGEKLEPEALEPTFFVPMTGRAEEVRQKKDDRGIPQLLNGGFESISELGVPSGWYYVRQATVVEDPRAPEGQRMLRFSNATPGRGAQALQSLAMDGRLVKSLQVTLWVETRDVEAGRLPHQAPHVEVSFFDEQRAPAGVSVLGRWQGSTPRSKRTHKVKVPARARLAVLAVGLFGATGELTIDELTMRVMND
jgi:protein-L-isoaspartate(D-aspartate) O-methyltransferase